MQDQNNSGGGDGFTPIPAQPDLVPWAAGLFEGEGTFFCKTQGTRGSGCQLRLGMTDRDVVERFQDIVGCGGLYVGKPGTGSQKPMYNWYLYEASNVVKVIEAFLPWLGERRTAKALEVLGVAKQIKLHSGKQTHCPQGHPYSGDNLVLEPVIRGSRRYFARRCKICRTTQSRERARARRARAKIIDEG